MTFTRMVQPSGILLLLPLFCSCKAADNDDITSPPEYTAFGAPERVTITGYDGDAMEPFLSRDRQYLFFNSAGGPTDKDLYYATYVDATTFTFRGAVGGVNTAAVDGAPTMDLGDRFYYVSTAAYNPPASYDTLFTGAFDRASGSVTGVTALSGLADRRAGRLNFDLEVSPDGGTLFFNDGVFSGNPFPDESDIAIAVGRGGRFERHPDSAALLASVNTADLEYAPAISADGLELFFTRLSLMRRETATYRTTRADSSSPFKPPQHVSAINGFAEGSTLSPDERSLYYHKNEGGTFVLYCVTR